MNPALDRPARAELRRLLPELEPWLRATETGPRAVDAGACDRCGIWPRLLPTCGPVAWPALCRPCAEEVGTDAWCDGHADEGRDALAWARDLPPHWDLVVTLWWIATGEVRHDALGHRDLARLPAPLRAPLT